MLRSVVEPSTLPILPWTLTPFMWMLPSTSSVACGFGVLMPTFFFRSAERRTLRDSKIQIQTAQRIELVLGLQMEVVGTVGIQITQFQIGVAERGSVFCRAGIDAGVAAVTALTGFLVTIPYINHAVFLRPVYGHSRNRAAEFELHFRFNVVGSSERHRGLLRLCVWDDRNSLRNAGGITAGVRDRERDRYAAGLGDLSDCDSRPS